MQVSADLGATAIPELAQHLGGAGVSRDVIRRKVRGPHAQTLEHLGLPPELGDVLDRDAVSAPMPVVLLRIERHDEQRRGVVRSHRVALLRNAAIASSSRRPRPLHPERNTTISPVMRCDGFHAFLYSSSPRRKLKIR